MCVCVRFFACIHICICTILDVSDVKCVVSNHYFALSMLSQLYMCACVCVFVYLCMYLSTILDVSDVECDVDNHYFGANMLPH